MNTARLQCPCASGEVYAACCGRYHRGETEAPDAATLMRSRFAAFARREVHYLWRTLHASHPDRAQPMEVGIAAIRRSAETCRYMGLTVHDHEEGTIDEVARVLFEARVFLKGRDVSFVECSDFLHDGVGWRYLAGVSVARGGLRLGPTEVTIRRFCEVHGHRSRGHESPGH